MKFVKHLVVLAIALCAIPSVSKAQTVMAVGGGSSAIFLEMGQGAQAAPATSTPCVWTQGKVATVVARDNRTIPALGVPTDEQGNIWITWSQGTGAGHTCANPVNPGVNVYSYMQLDSVVGVKCYFENDGSGPGCIQVMTIAAGTAGANKLGVADTAIPALIIGALNGKHFTYAGTDIRPEDAQYANNRMFWPCGSILYRNSYDLGYRLTYGLGYAGPNPHIGKTVGSAFSAALFNVLDFNYASPDPFTGAPNPAYQVDPIGAQPIVVAVAPIGADFAGVSDINGFTLSLFYEGVLARSTDILGGTGVNKPVVTLVREPLSGTYNTMEFSAPNSSQYHTSQDDNFCDGAGGVQNQTMNVASALGLVPGAARKRVIGTGEMVQQLGLAVNDTLGYFFWSQANADNDPVRSPKGLLGNAKYLTVNGVDPLLDSYGVSGGVAYTPGAFPQLVGGGGVPPVTAVTFKNLNAGDYSIWSAVRLVGLPGDVGVANLITASHTQDAIQHDYVTLANLKVWHSHFPLYGITPAVNNNGSQINAANDLCPGGNPESGGDAGGTNVLKVNNVDFCTDYGNPNGLLNKTN